MKIAESQSEQTADYRLLSDQENQLRMVTVSMVGQFQAYVSDMLNELCDQLPDNWDGLLPFQKRYVAVHLRRRLEDLLESHQESDFADDRTAEHFQRAFLESAEWPRRPSALITSSHRRDLAGFLGDNGSKALDRAISQFRPDGMKFSDWLGRNHPRYRGYFDHLDNAIRLRNEAAHGQIRQRLTLRDVRLYRVVIYRLVQKADEYLGERTA
jgi:hypothetical protein